MQVKSYCDKCLHLPADLPFLLLLNFMYISFTFVDISINVIWLIKIRIK